MNQYADYRIAVVTSRFNEEVTYGLREGAKNALAEYKISHVSFFDAPGAFEIPLIAQTLANTKRFDGVICLGCVIKGDTAHFEFISLGATMGIQQASLQTGIPITFGIITTYDDEQAVIRSRAHGELASQNKGREAALACVESIETLRNIRSN
jgi:6,7-dimethyl-8-ribityllumazine synthase